jgi:hypothetical protein
MPPTTLTVVGDEMEAEVLCGLLRANGIRCAYRKSNTAAAISALAAGGPIAGPTEVLVAEADLAAAQALLRKS